MAAPASKKLVDSWKSKKWYTVIAPNFLNNIEAAQIPSLEDDSMMNRIIEIPLKEITRDLNHMYTSIKLRIHEIKGRKAYTKFIGHSIAREYLRSLVRRRRDVVDVVFPTVSKDGIEFRIKAMVVTENGCSQRQRKSLRKKIIEVLGAKAQGQDFGEFIKEIVLGRGVQDLHDQLGKITPIRRVEVWKTALKEEFDTDDVRDLPKPEHESQGQQSLQRPPLEEEKPAEAPAATTA